MRISKISAKDRYPRNLQLKKPPKVNLQDYKFLKVLGEGAFGRVSLVQNIKTQKFWAIKQLKKDQIIKNKQVDHLKNETYILNSVNYFLFVKMEGITQDPKFLYILMEFISGGELFTYHRQVGKFGTYQSSFYAAQVVLMFEHLHSFNIVYRDLKPENLLIDQSGNLKLTDFGFAKIIEKRTYTVCGTPAYIAPEILLNKGHGKAADWWSFGVLIYEFLAGYDPFYAEDPMMLYQNILSLKYKFPPRFDKKAKSLIKHLLCLDLSKRFGNLKNGCLDIKIHRFFDMLNWQDMEMNKVRPPYVPFKKKAGGNFNFRASPLGNVQAISSSKDPFLNW